MPKIRQGIVDKRARGRAVVNKADLVALLRSAQSARNMAELRSVLLELLLVVMRLAEAVGLEPVTAEKLGGGRE